MESHPDNPGSSRDALETMRRLEAIVASAIDGIITINDLQRIVLFNPAAEVMFGLSADEALGEHISRFIPERYRAAHAAHIHRFAQTGVTNRRMGALGAINGLRADGKEFPIEASISQVEVGGELLSTVILRDITERKASEEALRESRQRMEGIVESAMDALITVDEQQRIMLFNPAAERMFGVPSAQAVRAPIERFIPERFRPGHSEHIRRFKETGVTNRRMGALGAISGLRANGEEFPLEASISQVEVGGLKIATVILRDITERLASEEARNLLAREVDHRAKNALAVVQAVVSLTRAPTTEAFVTAVRGRVSALGRAHSLLARNRWQGGDLTQIITDETAPYEKPGQIQIRGPSVVLDPNAVQHVSLMIHELATNAVKYGALSVDQGRVDIRLTILPGQQLELCWTETGGPAAGEPASTGFGSTLVSQLATRQLGGSVNMSWPVEGLRLVATLPSSVYRRDVVPKQATAKDVKQELNAASRGACVLVVEDEMLIAMELCAALTEFGWKIIGPAATIEEANRLITETPHLDAAVLDVNLAGHLAYPVAERLRSQGVPFVFCTGYEQLDHHERYGDYPIVRKPVNLRMLDDELHRLPPAA
ncbi:MAG TPA: PAS domain S-box protein [Caulobacteraceae bacterium]|jgi:PAS domain S-box-containing protein